MIHWMYPTYLIEEGDGYYIFVKLNREYAEEPTEELTVKQ